MPNNDPRAIATTGLDFGEEERFVTAVAVDEAMMGSWKVEVGFIEEDGEELMSVVALVYISPLTIAYG